MTCFILNELPTTRLAVEACLRINENKVLWSDKVLGCSCSERGRDSGADTETGTGSSHIAEQVWWDRTVAKGRLVFWTLQ